jgi:hypothetical protein
MLPHDFVERGRWCPMVAKATVMLSDDLIAHSRRFGAAVVASYEAGDNPASRDVSSHGAESNAELQAHGRMAEIAFCLYAGLDPLTALNWRLRCDPGFDVVAFGVRWDIKATRRGHYLIWPINKRHIFASKRFDTLALVRGEAPRFTLAGFTNKPFFAGEHQVATLGHCLDPGTWYMHDSELWPFT